VVDDQTRCRETGGARCSTAVTATWWRPRARSGRAALCSTGQGFDLIVSDLKMPRARRAETSKSRWTPCPLARYAPDPPTHSYPASWKSPEYAGFLQGASVQVLSSSLTSTTCTARVTAILAGCLRRRPGRFSDCGR